MIKRLIVSLGGVGRRAYHGYLQNRAISALEDSLEYRFIVHYKKDNLSLLSELCDKYGSDKGEIKQSGHHYRWPSQTCADFYSRLFDHCRLSIKNVFECGIGTNNPNLASSMGISGKPGVSLRVWKDYFPNAQVYGADIDKDILFEEERIKTFYIDQTDPSAIDELWGAVGCDGFQLMVDDGLHTFAAGICLFEKSISRLSNDGIYIIEDISISDLSKYQHYFAQKDYKVDYVNLFCPYFWLGDNSLVVIRR
jgi:hypothetical protein